MVWGFGWVLSHVGCRITGIYGGYVGIHRVWASEVSVWRLASRVQSLGF